MLEPNTSFNSENKSLQEKLNFLEKISDLNPNLLYIIQLNPHKIVYINNVIKILLGHPPSYFIEKGPEIFESVIFPEDYDLWLKNLQGCYRGEDEKPCEVEIRVLTAKDEWRWFKIKDKIFERSKTGEVTHIIGTAQDIHEQKIWEEKQREEHRRLRNAQEIGHIGSFERKLPGDRVYYSNEFYRILGLEPREGEIDHHEFMSHVHPDDRKAYQNAINLIHEKGEPVDIVTRAIRPDGSLRYLHRRAAVIKDKAGNPVRVYGTAQDITERVIVEQERKRLENLMHSTEIVAETGSYEADITNNKIYFSNGLYRLFGYEPGEFEPSRDWINKHSHPDDVSIVRQILEETANSRKGYTYTRRIIRKDGELRILESQGSIIVNDEDRPIKFIGLVQDVTARKKAEEELRKSEERSRNLLNVLQDVPDSYLILTPDFTIEMASDSYLEESLTKREEIIGKYIFDAFPDNPADPKATGVKNLRNSLKTVLSTKRPHRMPIQQYDVKNHEGNFEEKYWSPTNTPVLNSHGEIDYIIHRVLNITEVIKKQTAEKELYSETEILKTSLEEIKLQASQIQESRSLLQSIFDASPNSLSLYKILRDKNGKVLDFEISMINAFNIEQLGISPTVIGKKLTEEFPNVKHNNTLKEFIATAETGVSANFETFYQGEGLNHWFHYRVNKIDNLILVTTEDITERKKSEELVQQMLNGSISAITILESVRDDNGKIIDFKFKGANKAAEKINSMPAKDMVGYNLLELFPGVKEAFFETYVKVVETGEPLRVQRYYSYDNFNHWFDVSAVKAGDGFIMTFNDISEQKNAEQELIQVKEVLAQQAQDRYLKIINSMDEGFCLLELIYNENKECIDYRYLEINPVFEKQSGLKDPVGRTIKEMAPTIESYWFRYYESVAKTGKPLRFEDYSEPLEKWFEVYAFKLDEQEENKVGVIFKDITERKEAEDRQKFLLELNVALRPLVGPEEIQLTAMEILGKHLEVNRAFYSEPYNQDEEKLQSNPGYNKGVHRAPEETNFSDYKPEIIERFLKGETIVVEDALLEKVLKEDQEKVVENLQTRAAIAVPLVRNKKLVAAIRVHQSSPRRWTPAEVALVEEVCRFTWAEVERARSENALKESEQKFRDLVEASALAVWETNAEGVVVTDSPSWRTFTGLSFKEWEGSGWLKTVHPEDRDFVKERWKEAVAANLKFDTEYRLLGINGESRWTNVKAIPIVNLEGKITKWAGMNLDIHDMKMTEEALRKAKNEAEAASRAKEDFVSTMSHEIRTPLNAIIGLTNLLKDQKPREDQKENLSSLSFSARNLLVLINDILDFSKLEAGKMEISEIDFNLSDLLSNLQKAHQPQAKSNKSIIILDLEEKIPGIIATDQVKLSQILHNLVGNAVKFTHNGEIKISVKMNRQDKDIFWLDFAVQDTGIGIAADKANHIFDKFAQAESSTVRNYGGTGLGLSITKLLLELLGSDIFLESKLGEGSRFYFTLPVKQGYKNIATPNLEQITDGPGDLSHLQFLLVEDVEINRKILMQFLQNWWQLVPDEAVNGKEAVEKAKNNQYDLILMDVRMPEMDGYEATSHIRKLSEYKEIPILALTADKKQEAEQARPDTPFSDILTKPFEPQDLKQRILHHLKISGKDLLEPAASGDSKFRFKATPVNEDEVDQKNNNSPQPILEISRYEEICAGNSQILEKLIRNAIKAFETYKKEFAVAANAEDLNSLSDLVHKNTTSVHYIQAVQLADSIEEFREHLRNPAPKKDVLEAQKGSVLSNFDMVINALQTYL